MTQSNQPSNLSMIQVLRAHATAASKMELDLTGAICYDAADELERLAAESEARHQSCLVLMRSVQDHRSEIERLRAVLTRIALPGTHAPDPVTLLKPCPFCGGDALIMVHGNAGPKKPHYFYGNCITCDAEGPPETTAERAHQSWNQRRGASAVASVASSPTVVGHDETSAHTQNPKDQ